MKSYFGLLISLLCLLCSGVVDAQNRTDSLRFKEYLEVRHTDAMSWINRYENDIDVYRAINRTLTDRSCDVLFLGSSSINLWDSIVRDMSPLKIIRRSYGGAAIRDMLYNYDVIARGFNPKAIVLYVENDLAGSKDDLTVGETYDFFRLFLSKLVRDYPTKPVFLLSFKPSYARLKMLAKQKAINSLLSEWCTTQPTVRFVDVATCLYDEQNKLREDIFKADRLHMNQKGYDLWTRELKPKLLNVCK